MMEDEPESVKRVLVNLLVRKYEWPHDAKFVRPISCLNGEIASDFVDLVSI